MVSKKLLESVEGAVLDTYKRENPSTYFIDQNYEEFLHREKARVRLFRDLLNFPPKMFNGCSLLDFGAGTGEHSVYYAKWRAKCTLVENNTEACNRAKIIFDKYASNNKPKIINASLFNYKSQEKFDIVVTDAVIHHTADKEGAFAKLTSFLKEGGYVFLGIGNAAGSFQRMLQRRIIHSFAGTEEEEVIRVVETLFKEHVDRAEKYGKRTRRAIIFDTYINPKHDNPTVAEVLRWFSDNGLRFYSAWPPIIPSMLGDSGMRPTFNPLDFPAIGALPEAMWLAHGNDDCTDVPEQLRGFTELSERQSLLTCYMNDYSPQKAFEPDRFRGMIEAYRCSLQVSNPLAGITEKIKKILLEIEEMLEILEQRNLKKLRAHLTASKHLFRGTSGLGMSYFIAYKPDAK